MTGRPAVRRLTIPGEPLGKARPRVTRRGTYTPRATRDAEAAIREPWAAAHAGLEVDASSRFGMRLTFRRFYRHRRDVDNLAKLVMDALNGAPGAYADDHQVEFLAAQVLWVPREEVATHVALWTLGRPVPPVQALPRSP